MSNLSMSVPLSKGLRKMFILFGLVIMFSAMSLFSPIATQTAKAAGNSYYVSDSTGNDTNPGTLSQPWKTLAKIAQQSFNPGDTIYLKSGDTWSNQRLLISSSNGSGTSGMQITLTSYGTGNKPHITSNQDVVVLSDVSYWTVSGLEVENTTTTLWTTAGAVHNVFAVICNIGTPSISGIVIQNNDIHASTSNPYTSTNGLAVYAVGDITVNRISDVMVTGNIVHDVGDRGLMFNTENGAYSPPYDSRAQTNIKIFNNEVYNFGTDGLLVLSLNNSKVQWNKVHDGGRQTSLGYAPGAIWCVAAVNVKFKFNEAYNQSDAGTGGDASGFDIDYFSDHVSVDYNYAHDNYGNGVFTMPTSYATINYNRFVNNRNETHHATVSLENAENSIASNNVIIRTLYNASYKSALGVVHWPNSTGNQITNNRVVFGSSPYNVYSFNTGVPSTLVNSNKIYGFADGSFVSNIGGANYNSFTSWKSGTGLDANSTLSTAYDTTAPTSPSSHSASSSSGQVSLSWTGSTDAGSGLWHYLIFRSTVSGFTPAYMNLVGGTSDTGTSYTDSEELVSGQIYYYKIVAVDNSGNWSSASANTSVTVSNMVTNPGFETGSLSPWLSGGGIITNTNARTGTYAGKLTGIQAIEQTITVSPNTTYTLSGYAKTEDGTVYIGVKNYGGTETNSGISSASYSSSGNISFTTGTTNTTAVIYCYKLTGTLAAYCDDFRVGIATAGGRVFEAESIEARHMIGRVDGIGWSANTTQDNANHFVYGPYWSTIATGSHKVVFRMMEDNNTANNDAVVKIDVNDATSSTVLAQRIITRQEFSAANVYKDFALSFNSTAGHQLEFRIYWYDSSYINVDKITLDPS